MTSTESDPLDQVPAGRREYASQLWRHIPESGLPIGNTRLRSLSKTTSDDGYWAARNAMVDAGLITLGGGRGGSVKRSDAYADESAVSEPVSTQGLELSLYDGIKARLEEIVEQEHRFDDHIIDRTGLGGRRKTGGAWTRPDLTLVGVRTFKVLAGAHLEVQTFEIKTSAAFNIVALHEARAHRRRAHRSFVIVDLEDKDDEDRVGDLVDEAHDLGVGLISFVATDDEWNYWYVPEIVLPDPVDLDEFLATQLSDASKETIRGWQALPALGGTE